MLTMKHLSKRAVWHLPRRTGRLLIQVALLLRCPGLSLGAANENNLFFHAGTTVCKCPPLSHRYSVAFFCHCYAILSTFMITSFSFLHVFPIGIFPLVDKCVCGVSTCTNPMPKLLSKINKRSAETGWEWEGVCGGVGELKMKGREGKKNTEGEPCVMLEGPLRMLSIFPSIFGVQARIRSH